MEITKENIKKVGFTADSIFIITNDDVKKAMPLHWFKRLDNATIKQKQNFTLSHFGIHWEELDEDLSFEGFFTYDKDKIQQPTKAQKLLSELSFLNLEEVGKVANINPTLLRHYACGVKKPSNKRLQEIKTALQQIGKRILEVA